MENFEKWAENILGELKHNPQKNVILIAGASGSGKSYNANKLCDYLQKNGFNANSFSADNYYKGISKLLVEKTFMNNPQFYKHEKNKQEIINALKKIIEPAPFTEKFNDFNYKKIHGSLKSILQTDNNAFCLALKHEFDNINFDEPFALDLTRLSNDINSLISGQDIILPYYSFASGEVTYDKNNIIKGGTGIYIVEGLYTLRDEVYGQIDNKYIIPCFIDCNLKTLLSRRLNRDVKSARTTFSPEQTIISTITKVMPSYCMFIEPYKKNSKFTLETSLTENEISKKESSHQLKFKLNKAQENALNVLNLNKLKTSKQTDYYLNDNTDEQAFILRLREENGYASKLTFKNNQSTSFEINRKIDEYNLSDFAINNKEISFFLENIKNSGFKIATVINKTRDIVSYNQSTFKVDHVENLGTFIEFDSLNDDSKKIIDILKLTDIQNNSYFDMANQKEQLLHKEKEYKFLIDKIPKINAKKQEIIQFYFNFLEFKDYLLKLNPKLNLKNVNSARVRRIKENDKIKYYLTLKSFGNFSREEQEFLIDEKIAKFLIKKSNSYIKKTRYKYYRNNFVFEFDQLSNGLTFLEVEVKDESQYHLITQILKDLNIKFKDVTNNQSYKNQNLAEPIKGE